MINNPTKKNKTKKEKKSVSFRLPEEQVEFLDKQVELLSSRGEEKNRTDILVEILKQCEENGGLLPKGGQIDKTLELLDSLCAEEQKESVLQKNCQLFIRKIEANTASNNRLLSEADTRVFRKLLIDLQFRGMFQEIQLLNTALEKAKQERILFLKKQEEEAEQKKQQLIQSLEKKQKEPQNGSAEMFNLEKIEEKYEQIVYDEFLLKQKLQKAIEKEL